MNRWLWAVALLWVGSVAMNAEAAEQGSLNDEPPHSHDEALSITTEDPELKEQILKINDVLEELHQQMADRKGAIQAVSSDAKKAALYVELDRLRKEHDMLERLLHELVEEAKATEWTTIDEALKRARAVERHQERAYQREENLRERQQ